MDNQPVFTKQDVVKKIGEQKIFQGFYPEIHGTTLIELDGVKMTAGEARGMAFKTIKILPMQRSGLDTKVQFINVHYKENEGIALDKWSMGKVTQIIVPPNIDLFRITTLINNAIQEMTK